MTSYQVKFWDVKKIGDTAKGRRWVRWAVAGREHCKSFTARPLADGFLTDLKNAAHGHRPFDETTGLPAQPGHAAKPLDLPGGTGHRGLSQAEGSSASAGGPFRVAPDQPGDQAA